MPPKASKGNILLPMITKPIVREKYVPPSQSTIGWYHEFSIQPRHGGVIDTLTVRFTKSPGDRSCWWLHSQPMDIFHSRRIEPVKVMERPGILSKVALWIAMVIPVVWRPISDVCNWVKNKEMKVTYSPRVIFFKEHPTKLSIHTSCS